MARKRLVGAVLCAAMVAIPLAGLRVARPHPSKSTVEVAAVATGPTAALVDDARATPQRASRSAGWARREIEQLALEDFAPTTTAAPPTTAAPARRTTTTVAARVARTPSTTAAPKPKPATTTTTAAPRRAAAPSSPPPTSADRSQSGKASYYEAAPAGTCAHRTLPMGTIVKVTRVATGASITCKVSDRGPYAGGFIIDLAKSDFAQLAPISDGVTEVRLTW
jgi:rare lipoprotein A